MRYKGTVSAKGLAVGRVFLYEPYTPSVAETEVSEAEKAAEVERYHAAHRRAKEELDALLRKMQERDPKQAKIFQAHMDILDDVVMVEEITGAIDGGGWNAARAVDFVYTQYADVLKASDNALIAERVADMLDVRLRLLRCLEEKPENELASLREPVVLVARDLLPSDTAVLDPAMVLAIVTEFGGATSHSAIIARSYGIPALAGIRDVCTLVQDGETVVVDALEGALVTDSGTGGGAALRKAAGGTAAGAGGKPEVPLRAGAHHRRRAGAGAGQHRRRGRQGACLRGICGRRGTVPDGVSLHGQKRAAG